MWIRFLVATVLLSSFSVLTQLPNLILAKSADAAVLIDPSFGSTLDSNEVTFEWSAGYQISEYFLYLGTTTGANDMYGQSQGLNQSITIRGLPTDGNPIHIRVWSLLPSGWVFIDTGVHAASPGQKAVLTAPTDGSTLQGTEVILSWSSGTNALRYWLYLGRTSGAQDLFSQSQGLELSVTVNGLPDNGRTIYVWLWSLLPGGWEFSESTVSATTFVPQLNSGPIP